MLLEPEFSWLAVVLMATKEMLKFRYKLGQGLGAVGRVSPTFVELLDNKRRFSLGYEPTHKELFQASRGKKRKHGTLGMSIPISEPLYSFNRGRYARTFQGIER